MRFTLVYRGDLKPNASATEKWRIRRALEPQLRALWSSPGLKDSGKYQDPDYKPNDCYVGRRVGGIEYVPLISPKLALGAELKVYLLSASMPGGILNRGGDIDNRLKTLFDALSIPANIQQVPQDTETAPDHRVFCLMDDDRLITRVDISNDRLLGEPEASTEALIIIQVTPVATRALMANIGIAH